MAKMKVTHSLSPSLSLSLLTMQFPASLEASASLRIPSPFIASLTVHAGFELLISTWHECSEELRLILEQDVMFLIHFYEPHFHSIRRQYTQRGSYFLLLSTWVELTVIVWAIDTLDARDCYLQVSALKWQCIGQILLLGNCTKEIILEANHLEAQASITHTFLHFQVWWSKWNPDTFSTTKVSTLPHATLKVDAWRLKPNLEFVQWWGRAQDRDIGIPF